LSICELWFGLVGSDFRTGPKVPQGARALLRQFIVDELKISSEAGQFLQAISDSDFKYEMIARIFWDTGDEVYSEIQSEIMRLLAARARPIADRDEISAVTDRLWRHVTDRMASLEAAPPRQNKNLRAPFAGNHRPS
jgi:hypothetical protein